MFEARNYFPPVIFSIFPILPPSPQLGEPSIKQTCTALALLGCEGHRWAVLHYFCLLSGGFFLFLYLCYRIGVQPSGTVGLHVTAGGSQ